MKKFFVVLALVALVGCRAESEIEVGTSNPDLFSATVSYYFDIKEKEGTADFAAIIVNLTNKGTDDTKTYTLDVYAESVTRTKGDMVLAKDGTRMHTTYLENVPVIEDSTVEADGKISVGRIADNKLAMAGNLSLYQLRPDGTRSKLVDLTIQGHSVEISN